MTMAEDMGDHTASDPLAAAFVGYLADRYAPAAQRELLAALRDHGRVLESALLQRFVSDGAYSARAGDDAGPWAGRTMHVGWLPPSEPAAGELWWDPLELSLAVVLPSVATEPGADHEPAPAFESWLSVGPVRGWQFSAFLALAGFTDSGVPLRSELPLFDPARILAGAPDEAVTSLLQDEARLYAQWFGKVSATWWDWNAAAQHLPADQYDALWRGARREWAGDLDEGECVVVSPRSARLDPFAVYRGDAEPPDGEEMFLGDVDYDGEIGFRTAVPADEGVDPRSDDVPLGALNDVSFHLRLARALGRDVQKAARPSV